MSTKKLTRSAVLLALALVFQSLRLIPFIGNWPNQSLLIGSLVNLVLVIAGIIVGPFAAAIISIITPVVAFMQGFLPNPLIIIPIAAGNLVLSLIVAYFYKKNKYISLAVGAVLKWVVISNVATYVIKSFVNLPEQKINVLIQSMGIPQLITAVIGCVLALLITETLLKALKEN
ncbi:MAG: ECF transporter S component [Clostridiaceae bacterium]|nr:ECF transporter S component [Clostridiaceae bacterium]